MITKATTQIFGGYSSTGERLRVVGDLVIEGTAKDITYSKQEIVEIPSIEIAKEQPEIVDVRQLLDGKVLAADLTADEITAVLSLYTTWRAGEDVKINDLRTHGSKLYKTIQAHKTQVGWEPDKVPALFADVAPAGVIPDWVQPTSTVYYNKGDKMRYTDGKVYESLIDVNTWSPTVYPAGWKLIS